MNIDKYEEVINGRGTYKTIAEQLREGNSVIIGWTDEKFDHRDIFFSIGRTKKYGNLQRGIKPYYLFVGIMDFCFYGFNGGVKNPYYILEKLRLNDNETNLRIAELINGVLSELGEEL